MCVYMCVTHHADVTEEYGALGVNTQSLLKMNLSQVKLLLLVVDHSQAIPSEAEDHTHTHTQLIIILNNLLMG